MRSSNYSKLKPLIANLIRMEIGIFCSENSFDTLMFQHDLDELWNNEKQLVHPKSGSFNLPRDMYAARQKAVLNMFKKLSEADLERSIQLGYIVLDDFIRWQPDNAYLDQTIREFPRANTNDTRPRILNELLNQKRSTVQNAAPTTAHMVVEQPDSPKGLSRNVFVVHGHDEEDRLKLTRLLEKNLGLIAVVVQEETNASFETIFQKIERLAATCDLAIVLVTPDDECKAGMRPRENVVLELGYFLGLWKHLSHRRIIVLRKGDVTLLSDISGVVYLQYDKEIKDCYAELQSQLRAWGLPIS